MVRETTTNIPNSHDERDDLDELIAEIAKDHPEFPAMVEAAAQQRLAMRARGADPNGPADTETAPEIPHSVSQ